MADDTLLEPTAIDALLEADDLDGAREALQRAPAMDERYAVVRVKLALFDGSMPSGAAMQALIQLMRKDPEWPGARALYQTASSAAFETRQSSAAHSHPPPPVERK
jgi:predicted Zn-dependent protease